jgi:uncharacterized membrane protein
MASIQSFLENRALSKLNSIISFSFTPLYWPVITVKTNKRIFFLCFCHRKPDRSFFVMGRQFPLCSRCTGILAGCVIAIVLSTFSWIPSPTTCIIMLTPVILDGTGQTLGLWISTNTRRLVTGIFGGFAAWALLWYIFLL